MGLGNAQLAISVVVARVVGVTHGEAGRQGPEGALHNLRQRRVHVDGLHNGIGGGAHPHGVGRLLDQCRGVGADDMASQYLVRLGVDQHLDEPVPVLNG